MTTGPHPTGQLRTFADGDRFCILVLYVDQQPPRNSFVAAPAHPGLAAPTSRLDDSTRRDAIRGVLWRAPSDNHRNLLGTAVGQYWRSAMLGQIWSTWDMFASHLGVQRPSVHFLSGLTRVFRSGPSSTVIS